MGYIFKFESDFLYKRIICNKMLTDFPTELSAYKFAMNGFWGSQSERCFIDVRVFNPYAASNKINVPHFLLPTGSMKTSSVMLMANGLERWNMPLYTSCFVSYWRFSYHFLQMSGFSFID